MLKRHPIISVATFAYLGVVCWLTLNPAINSPEGSWLWWLYRSLERWGPTSWVTFAGVEFVINVIVFVPVGVLFLLFFGRRLWWVAIVFGVLGSCWIELAQYLWITERTADARDVLSNSIGIAIGVIAALAFTRPARSRRPSVGVVRESEVLPNA